MLALPPVVADIDPRHAVTAETMAEPSDLEWRSVLSMQSPRLQAFVLDLPSTKVGSRGSRVYARCRTCDEGSARDFRLWRGSDVGRQSYSPCPVHPYAAHEIMKNGWQIL